jgi:hypothetical protein
MAKQQQPNIITIDLREWTTQVDKAANTIGKSGKPVSVEYISKLIRLGKLRSKFIKELGITLVER